MIDQFEPKPILTIDNKLFYDGREVTAEEAGEIVKQQLREFEKSVSQSILQTPGLTQDSVHEIAEVITKTRVDVANNGITATDFDEYIDTGSNIMEAYKYSINRLKNLRIRNIERNPTNDYFSGIREKLGWSEGYVPTYRELLDQLFEITLTELIYDQLHKQFWNTGLKAGKQDIYISGDSFKEEFKVEIKVKNTSISFNIDLNNGSFEDITAKYIASGLKVGSIAIQTTLKDYLKHAGNNFKTAQTLDNLIKKQIRFLRTTIKQEITFSLEQNISSSEERLKLAKLYAKEYDLLIDNITRLKLNKIIISSERGLLKKKEAQKPEADDIVNNDNSQPDQTNKIIYYVKTVFSDIFNLKSNELKINFKKNKNDILAEFIFHNQRLGLTVNNTGNVSVNSSNYLGTGKKDIVIENISGKSLPHKIRKAALLAYQPVLNRQTESIIKRYKEPSQKKTGKSLETLFIHSTRLLTDTELTFNDKLAAIKGNIEKILDLLTGITENVHESYLEILDFIIKVISEELIENTTEDYNYEPDSSQPNTLKSSLHVFKISREEGNDIFESINEVRKEINRTLRSIMLINLLKFYRDFEVKGEITQTELTILEQLDLSIKKLANILSEDIIFGVVSRKLLALMSSSMLIRDDLFKNNLNEIIKDIIKLKG